MLNRKEKRLLVIVLILAAIILVFFQFFAPLISVNGYSRNDDQESAWDSSPPLFRDEPLEEVYLILPNQKEYLRITDAQSAQELLDLMLTYPTESTPRESNQIGILYRTQEEFATVYFSSDTMQSQQTLIEQTISSILPHTVSYVDFYHLLSPSQITRIEFNAINTNSDNDSDSRISLHGDFYQEESITQILDILRQVSVSSMELYAPEQQQLLPYDTSQELAYKITLYLGAAYDYQTITVVGYRYAFSAQLDFQNQTRLYTVDAATTQNLLNSLQNLSGVEIGEVGVIEPVIDYPTTPSAIPPEEELLFAQN